MKTVRGAEAPVVQISFIKLKNISLITMLVILFTLPFRQQSRIVTYCLTLSYSVLLCLTLSYSVLLCLTLSYSVLLCLTLSYFYVCGPTPLAPLPLFRRPGYNCFNVARTQNFQQQKFSYERKYSLHEEY